MNDDTNTATMDPPVNTTANGLEQIMHEENAAHPHPADIPPEVLVETPVNGQPSEPNGICVGADLPWLAEIERKAAAFDSIAEKEKEVASAYQVWHNANETAKAKKKAWEGLVAELQDEIREARDPAPLYKAAAAQTPTDDEDGQGSDVADPVTDDSWRDIPLDVALPDLSEAVLAKLYKANLHTMGELADWTGADGGRHRLSDLDGIGSGTAGKIEEATMAFWSRRGVTGIGSPKENAQKLSEDADRMADELVNVRKPEPEPNGQPHEPLLDRDRLILEAVSKEQDVRDVLHQFKLNGVSDGSLRLVLKKALAGNQAGAGDPGSWSVHDGKKLKLSLPGQQTETLSINGVAKAIRRILEIPKA